MYVQVPSAGASPSRGTQPRTLIFFATMHPLVGCLTALFSFFTASFPSEHIFSNISIATMCFIKVKEEEEYYRVPSRKVRVERRSRYSLSPPPSRPLPPPMITTYTRKLLPMPTQAPTVVLPPPEPTVAPSKASTKAPSAAPSAAPSKASKPKGRRVSRTMRAGLSRLPLCHSYPNHC